MKNIPFNKMNIIVRIPKNMCLYFMLILNHIEGRNRWTWDIENNCKYQVFEIARLRAYALPKNTVETVPVFKFLEELIYVRQIKRMLKHL